jgi:hypothetical protein
VFYPAGKCPVVTEGDLITEILINGSAPMHMKREGNTVSWYGSSPTGQLNDSKSTYVMGVRLAANG